METIESASPAAPENKLIAQIKDFPHRPGVYLMRDRAGRVLYVGKAKDLKKRAASYRQARGIKTHRLLERAAGLECIVTGNEKEALILESSLIKKYRPRYNVDLRDDKRYPCLRLDPGETFPHLQVVRKIKQDGAHYFGPFSAAGKLRSTLDLVQRMFPLRQCRRREPPRRSRPCLYFQTQRCPGPCREKISPEAYGERVQEVLQFFQGKNQDLLRGLRQKMTRASEALRFEEAASLRDRIRAVEETLKTQHVVSSRLVEADALGLMESAAGAAAIVLFIRFGSVTGLARFIIPNAFQTREELLTDFLIQYYQPGRYLPPRILLPFPLADRPLLEEVLSERRGRPVAIRVPLRGEGKKWLDLARENALEALKEKESPRRYAELIAGPLREKLGLRREPLQVAGLDISNLQGDQAVGSWVFFDRGLPEKNRYRRFRIRSWNQPNDVAMMTEVMGRLVRRPEELPDLILIDGGKGQLNALGEIIKELPDKDRPDLAAIAKKTFIPEGGKDGIYLPGRKNPLNLKPDSPLLHFLQRVRDEAHRFALSYHHVLRKKEIRQAPGGERRGKKG